MLEAILRRYEWFEHPEGMQFVETHRDAHRTVGHWLFLPGAISVVHRVRNCEEIWAIHLGSLHLHVIDPAGTHRQLRLGLDVASGELPVATVPRGSWQAAELPPGVAFAFGTNVCAPAFEYSELEIGRRGVLLAAFPQHREILARLTHDAGR